MSRWRTDLAALHATLAAAGARRVDAATYRLHGIFGTYAATQRADQCRVRPFLTSPTWPWERFNGARDAAGRRYAATIRDHWVLLPAVRQPDGTKDPIVLRLEQPDGTSVWIAPEGVWLAQWAWRERAMGAGMARLHRVFLDDESIVDALVDLHAATGDVHGVPAAFEQYLEIA